MRNMVLSSFKYRASPSYFRVGMHDVWMEGT